MQRLPVSFFIFFIEKLRLFAHVVGSPSHKGIARRALPASGGVKMKWGEIKKLIKLNDTHAFSM